MCRLQESKEFWQSCTLLSTQDHTPGAWHRQNTWQVSVEGVNKWVNEWMFFIMISASGTWILGSSFQTFHFTMGKMQSKKGNIVFSKATWKVNYTAGTKIWLLNSWTNLLSDVLHLWTVLTWLGNGRNFFLPIHCWAN
jgi:hypothetical protein